MTLIEAFKALCEKPDDTDIAKQFEQLLALPENQAHRQCIMKTALHFGWLENGLMIYNPDFSEYSEGMVIWETEDDALLFGYSPNDSVPYENSCLITHFFAQLDKYVDGTATPYYPAILAFDWGELLQVSGDYSDIQTRRTTECKPACIEFHINAYVA